jgi:protein tyrosine phosphatase
MSMLVNPNSKSIAGLDNGYLRVESNKLVAKQAGLIGRFVQILSQHGDTFASFSSVQKHREKNKEAVAFAEKIGFTIQDKDKESYAKPLTARVLKRDLMPTMLPSFKELRKSTDSKINAETGFYSDKAVIKRYDNINVPAKKIIETTTGGKTEALHANKVEFNFENITLPNTLIAMQAPKTETLTSVIGMLHDQKVEFVVDLTNSADLHPKDKKGRSLTPKTIDYMKMITDGDVKDEKLSVTRQSGGTVSDNNTFKYRDIDITKSGKEQSVKHIHYSNWPDHGAVGLEEFDKLVSKISEKIGDKTCAIHCSAGVGRTGTLMTGLMLKHLANEGILNDGNIDKALETLIKQGRDDRGPMFVQTDAQQNLLRDYAKKLTGW